MPKVLLGDVAEERKETYKGDKSSCRIVGLEHLVPEQLVLKNWDHDDESTFTKRFYEGDILFGRRRAYLKKASIATFDGICSGDITVIKAKPDSIYPKLLPFVIQNDRLFEYAVGMSAGSLSPRVKWENLKNYKFWLPDFDKQRELADVLWSINDTIESYNDLMIATDKMVKSQFIEMFGLPESNIHDYEVGQIRDVVCDVHYGTSKKASEDGAYTYIRMNNITYGGELDLSDVKRISVPEKDLTGCLVQKGDVLFNRTNSRDLVGKTCTFNSNEPMIIAGYIIRLRMNGKVIPEYLSTFLNLDRSKRMLMTMAKGAVGQANINAQEIQDVDIIIPPQSLQQSFKSLVEQSDKSKSELDKTIEKLKVTLRGVITENLELETEAV